MGEDEGGRKSTRKRSRGVGLGRWEWLMRESETRFSSSFRFDHSHNLLRKERSGSRFGLDVGDEMGKVRFLIDDECFKRERVYSTASLPSPLPFPARSNCEVQIGRFKFETAGPRTTGGARSSR